MAAADQLGDATSDQPPQTPSIDDVVAGWQQGDIFDGTGPPVLRLRAPTAAGADGSSRRVTPIEYDRLVVVSQTCDVVRPCDVRPSLAVAPVVVLEGQHLANASRGRVPRYVSIPGGEPNWFADLDQLTTFEKGVLVGRFVRRGCATDEDVRLFGRFCARHFGRFAFPDDFDRAVRPFADRLTKRSGKNSPEGRRVNEIEEIRVLASPDWSSPSDITILFVIDAASMPHMEETVPGKFGEVLSRSIDELCAALDSEMEPGTRCALWDVLVQAWVDLCDSDKYGQTIAGQPVTLQSINASMYSRSDPLDLGYLSSDDM